MAPGTPGFTAPEVLLRNEVGPAADVFALGATIAYTATGRPPYGTGEAAAVSYRTVHEDIDLAGVQPELATLIRQCVAKDPAERPEPAAVIARCAVDSALATDAHYRSVARDAEPEPEPVPELVPDPVPVPVPGREPETVPTGPSDTTPYGGPDDQRRPARTGRRTGWLAACAVALAVPTTVWLLGEQDDQNSGTAPTTDATVSRPATTGPAGGPPDHIVNDRVSQDRWTLSDDSAQAAQGIGSCDLASYANSSPPMDLQSSVSHTTGSDTASVSLRPKTAGQGKRPAPYYVSVGLRPPHETDRTTGRPLASVSKGIGFTSKPFDMYSQWSSGGTIKLKYPDDFRAHFGNRTIDAIPVSDDRGDWTVVFYHVEGGPTKYTSVVCNGFHA
ncbi:protein kinase [Streptomyces sp. NPDC052236]|uniref:protein kinase domain-containing protein n=1 Tax=Streptomyces sp. NPDC052236 TaxID=3365686 RepID=UPI0037D7290B